MVLSNTDPKRAEFSEFSAARAGKVVHSSKFVQPSPTQDKKTFFERRTLMLTLLPPLLNNWQKLLHKDTLANAVHRIMWFVITTLMILL